MLIYYVIIAVKNHKNFKKTPETVLHLVGNTVLEPENHSYFVSTVNRHTTSIYQQSSCLSLAMQHPRKEQA